MYHNANVNTSHSRPCRRAPYFRNRGAVDQRNALFTHVTESGAHVIESGTHAEESCHTCSGCCWAMPNFEAHMRMRDGKYHTKVSRKRDVWMDEEGVPVCATLIFTHMSRFCVPIFCKYDVYSPHVLRHHCVAEFGSVLQCAAVCSTVLQCAALR